MPPKLQILIVDDEEIMHALLTSFIVDLGHHSHSVYNGEDALEIMQEQSFDLVLTDVRMPGISGLELLEKIHQHAPSLPVIVITGHGDPQMSEKAKALGAYDFLIKPLNLAHFMTMIQQITELKADA